MTNIFTQKKIMTMTIIILKKIIKIKNLQVVARDRR
jgi:hypothetical protein